MVYNYYVYILTNSRKTVLYTGITNNLKRRITEHKQGKGSQFTRRYNLCVLVYYEVFTDPENAIRREKQLKNISRHKKEALINSINPLWKDAYEELI